MTILYICNEYPPGKSGGIGSMTRTLARAMVSKGHNVLVAGLYLPGYGEADFETDNGVKVWRKRLLVDIGIIKNNYSVLDTLLLKSLSASGILQKDLVNNISAFNKFIATVINDYNVDIIEWPDFNEWFQYLNTPVQWPELKIPLIIKFHGTQTFLNYPSQPNKNLYLREKEHISRATAFIAVSQHTADSYKQLYDLQKPITTLYNSIELCDEIYYLKKATPKIIFTGSLTERKGVLSLIKAWNIVHEKLPNATLELFGKGKINTFLKESSPAAKSSIRYHGFVTKEEIDNALRTASAAIFPSYSECFALAPLEAMAAGCSVIYTERFSGPELISDGINGLLINPDDPEQMADAIIRLIQNESLRNTFSVNGRKTVAAHFNIDQSVHDHIKLYEHLKQQQQLKAIRL